MSATTDSPEPPAKRKRGRIPRSEGGHFERDFPHRKRRILRTHITGYAPLDVILIKMRYHMGAADNEAGKPKPNREKLERSLDKAEEAAKAAAPYVHPRLAAMVHANASGKTLEQLVASSYAAEALLTDASEKAEHEPQTIEGEVVEREKADPSA